MIIQPRYRCQNQIVPTSQSTVFAFRACFCLPGSSDGAFTLFSFAVTAPCCVELESQWRKWKSVEKCLALIKPKGREKQVCLLLFLPRWQNHSDRQFPRWGTPEEQAAWSVPVICITYIYMGNCFSQRN